MRYIIKYTIVMVAVFTQLGCDDIVDLVDITDETIVVLAPTDGVTLDDDTINFSWSSIDGAEDYRLQIATPNFENAVSIALDSTVTTTTFSQPLETGNYQWRVSAQNTNYQTAYSTQSFAVLLGDPVDISGIEVQLLAPANSASFTETDTIAFSWDAVTNADSYVIQIATPSFDNATSIIENQTVATTSFSVSNLDAQSYEWRVKATNASFETAYTTQNFIVEN